MTGLSKVALELNFEHGKLFQSPSAMHHAYVQPYAGKFYLGVTLIIPDPKFL